MLGYCEDCRTWHEPKGKELLCSHCFDERGSRYAQPLKLAKDMKDEELIEKAVEPFKAFQERTGYYKYWPDDSSVKQAKKDLTSINLLDLARDELGEKVAGDLSQPLAIFLHYASAYVKGGARNLIVTGQYGIGKDHIVQAVADLFPQEFVISRRRISARAVDYMFNDLSHEWLTGRNLILEDIESGVLNESGSLKTFASAPTDKVHSTTIVEKGRAMNLRLLGRPVITITTANAEARDEMLSRFDSLEIADSERRYEEIITMQARKAAETTDLNGKSTVQAYLCLLKPVKVVVPFAGELAKIWPKSSRASREFPRFLSLVKASAALNQFKREKTQDDTTAVIATHDDYLSARDAYLCFTQGELAGLTRPLLSTYRAVLKASRKREDNPISVLKAVETRDNYGNTKYERQITQDLSRIGWVTVNDVVVENPMYSIQTIYEHINKLKERGVIEIDFNQTTISDKPVMLISAKASTPILLPESISSISTFSPENV